MILFLVKLIKFNLLQPFFNICKKLHCKKFVLLKFVLVICKLIKSHNTNYCIISAKSVFLFFN